MKTMVEVVSSAPILRQLSAREDKRIESNATALFRQISESAIERKTKNGSIITVDFTTEVASEAAKRRERLLNALKKEVKVIMEESVNRRKIHVNSNYVTSLCASVEQCILDGLKRRLLGLFGSRSTYAFLRTISKHCAAAAAVLAKTIIVDKDEEGAFSQNFLWIRIALVEKKLPAILDFIHSSPQCRRYYEKSALMLDPVKGGVVAALLVGPSAVEYTSMRQADTWNDPSADELVQRHRMTSTTSASPKSPKRPPLSVMKRGSSIVNSIDNCSSAVCTFGRDYVYSLHQNVKSSLLYGKNNVTVALPPDGPPLKGYLSLHQNSPGNVTVKWTPNQLMHSSSQPVSATVESPPSCDSNWLWRHAINVNVADIIYIHIHQQSDDSPASIVFVGGDGVQHAPMQFPIGQHVLAFLSCLESGILPYSRLDPPLWVSEQKDFSYFHRRSFSTQSSSNFNGTPSFSGKIFPKLRRRTSMSTSDALTTSSIDDNEMHDYVFRIASVSIPAMEAIEKNNNVDDIVLDEIASTPESPKNTVDAETSRCANERRTESDSTVDRLVRQNLSSACTSMRTQILARAFYGWLAYCRHLRTVRTHLSRLIESDTIEEQVIGPVDEAFWQRCRAEKSKSLEREFLLRVYRYGIEGSDPCALRHQAWPYLLGLLSWSESIDDKYKQLSDKYNVAVEEWKKIEKIVRVRDHEAFTAARLRHSSYNGDLNLSMRELSINNDVFEENEGTVADTEPLNEKDKEEALISDFGMNLHRIEKDVDRCDRTSAFFSNDENLEKLKNVMCTHVWRNLTDGYVQGMCDLAAPLLVILEDEPIVLGCFDRLMVRMRANFPLGSGMDDNLANMRSLIQVMDPELFDLMMTNGDFTHLYFCYRWFLLDFKRELTYAQVFRVWEVIWACSRLITPHFQLFFALAILTTYRHIIIDNRMDFTDLIKFFNEMAERHNVEELLDSARCLLERLQALILELKNNSK